MLRRPRTVAAHEAALAELTEDLTRLTRMADELLELGTRERTQATCESHDLAAEAMSLHAARPVLVDLDAATIRRILDNLLDNAALHGAAPVTVTVDRVDGWARLKVSDCGPGMPPHLLATATDRFARSPEARSRPGSGLGLSLVAAIVTTTVGELRLCHAGHHHRVGVPVAVPCAHDTAMTVTVLLPHSAVL
jgi:two-component system OmpR family sensor kinase